MNSLDKLLKDQGIDPAPQEQWNPAPNEILEDLFKTLGDIFKPYEEENNIKPKGWRKK